MHKRFDGDIFKFINIKIKLKTEKNIIQYLLLAKDATFIAHFADNLHNFLKQLLSACSEFRLVFSDKR